MILAIDPGTFQSAYVLFNKGQLIEKDIVPNQDIIKLIENFPEDTAVKLVAIEFIQSYGMAVGREVFETVYWTGHFAQAAKSKNIEVKRFGRQAIKLFVAGIARATDMNVRQSLMLQYGGSKKGQPLEGVRNDIWAALALADYVWRASKSGELKEW